MITSEQTQQGSEGTALGAGELVGDKLRLDRFIARGGMGTVWAATHLVLASPVAIKFLDRLRGGAPEDVALRLDRFRFEAQISARLASHTQHMVAVHDAGVHRGMPYLVMELAPGKSLQDLLDERERITPSALIPVVEQIGEALDAAHRAGIVHRDVKPGNILFLDRRGGSRGSVTDEGETGVFVKLTDFGVAKPADGSEIDVVAPIQTAEGLVVGSPAYMSPEQIAGSGSSSGASDRWALGVVMYEALTGWLPFRGESLTDFAIGITARPHDPPTSIVEGLPKPLDAFFERALAKQAADRFGSCAEMARAFRDALAPTPLPLPLPEEAPPSARPSSSRLPWVLGGGALVAGIVGLLAIAFGGGARDASAVTPPGSAAATTGATPSAAPVETAAAAVTEPAASSSVGAEPASASAPPKKVRPPTRGTTSAPPAAAPRPPRTAKPVDPSDIH